MGLAQSRQIRRSRQQSNPHKPDFYFPPGDEAMERYYFTPLYYVEQLNPHGMSVGRCATIQEYTVVPGRTPTIRFGAKKIVIIENGKEIILDLISPPKPKKRNTRIRSRFGRFVNYSSTIQESVNTHNGLVLNMHRAPDNLYDNIACQQIAISALEDGDVQPVVLGEYSAEAGSTKALAEIAGKNMERNKNPLEPLTIFTLFIAILTLEYFKGLFSWPKGRKVTFNDQVTVHEFPVHSRKPKKSVKFADKPEYEGCAITKQDDHRDLIVDAQSSLDNLSTRSFSGSTSADTRTSSSSSRSRALMEELEGGQIDSSVAISANSSSSDSECCVPDAVCT